MEGRVKAKGNKWLVTCDAISPVGLEIFRRGGVKLRKPKTGNAGWRALRGRHCVHEAWPQLSDNGTLARLGGSKAKISLQSLPELLCRTGRVQNPHLLRGKHGAAALLAVRSVRQHHWGGDEYSS